MDTIDNRITSSSGVNAVNEADLERNSTEAQVDLDAEVAKKDKEIKELQQEQQQRAQQEDRAGNGLSGTDLGTEWDPWKMMVLRRL